MSFENKLQHYILNLRKPVSIQAILINWEAL